MKLTQCYEALVSLITDELVLVSLGNNTTVWQELIPREGNLYRCTMAAACGIGLGLALALPHRKVVVLEGDGSLFLGLGMLSTVAVKSPKNLIIMVTDNESYEFTGGQPTPTAGAANLEGIARNCGIPQAVTVREPGQTRAAYERALREPGPWFITAKVERSGHLVPKANLTKLENEFQFIRYIERTENLRILSEQVI